LVQKLALMNRLNSTLPTIQTSKLEALPDGAPLIKICDSDGDTNTGNVEVVAGTFPCTSYIAPSADSTLAIPKTVKYIPDQGQEICFGMVSSEYRLIEKLTVSLKFQICDVTTQFLDNPRIFEDGYLINKERSNQSYYQLKISARKNFFILQSLAETEIAVLNSNISHCIQQLLITSIRYEAFVNHNAWTEALQTWKKRWENGAITC
jgi:hypothetical protein